MATSRITPESLEDQKKIVQFYAEREGPFKSDQEQKEFNKQCYEKMGHPFPVEKSRSRNMSYVYKAIKDNKRMGWLNEKKHEPYMELFQKAVKIFQSPSKAKATTNVVDVEDEAPPVPVRRASLLQSARSVSNAGTNKNKLKINAGPTLREFRGHHVRAINKPSRPIGKIAANKKKVTSKDNTDNASNTISTEEFHKYVQEQNKTNELLTNNIIELKGMVTALTAGLLHRIPLATPEMNTSKRVANGNARAEK